MPPTEDAALERALTRKLYRKDCPTPDVLGEMRLGLLAEAQAGAVRAHPDACPHCQSEVRRLDRLLRFEDRERPGLGREGRRRRLR
jgi:anti-sigma factor RsiW